MQSYNKFFKFASVRVFFRKKIEFILLFYARRWLWILAYGRHLGPYFFLLAFFLPARVLSFVLLSRVLSFLSSCSRSFFRPFISCSFFFFLPARVLFFVLLEFIFLNKSPSKICIYQKFVVPLHSNLNILVRD